MTSQFSRASRQRLRVITIGIALLLGLWILFSPFGLLQYMKVQKRLVAIEQELAVLEQENSTLEKTNERLKKDGDYLEQLARKRFGMVRRNEIIFDFSK